MCHAVNEGVRRAATDGIVTTATMMAPCPWIDEAAALAIELGLPAGVHQTLTCEWDYLRWRPLTGGRSLAGSDGTFVRTVELARSCGLRHEIVGELLAQVRRVRALGVEPEYLDVHMGLAAPDAYTEVSEGTGIPFLYAPAPSFTSRATLSDRDAAVKKQWLSNYLTGLSEGVHLLVCHPGVESDELASLTAVGSVPYRWAAEYRLSDLEVLTDPEVRELITDRGIELCSFGEAFGR